MTNGDATETTALIAHSKAQALEWSLVLISQQIESTVLPTTNPNAWIVKVDPTHFQAAKELIQLYEQENQRWPFRYSIPQTHIPFDATSILWGIFTTAFYLLQQKHPIIQLLGVASVDHVRQGEWWRIFTSTFLHADVPHLLGNLVIGVPLMGLCMGRFGFGIALLSTFIAAALGNLISLSVSGDPKMSLGTSGVVFAALGMLTAHWISALMGLRISWRYVIKAVLAAVLLLVLCGFSPQADTIAHMGGFVIGVILGLPIATLQTLTRKLSLNVLCATAYFLGIITPWALAFGRYLD